MRAIVFDLDGTLVDSAADITDAVNLMLAGHGLAAMEVEAIAPLTGEGAGVLVERVRRARGLDADEAEIRRDTATYLRHYAARPCARSVLFADAAETLPALHRAGRPLGVCTNKPEALARQVLEALGIDRCFGVVVGADTTDARKPDPRPLRYALDRLGASAADAVLVGDTAIDAATAAAAGVAFRAVAWGRELPGAPRIARLAELLTL